MQHHAGEAQGEVLGFWFAPGMEEKWFVKDAAFDDEVRRRLSVHYEKAAAGRYGAWCGTPRGCLALCILLDQAPRNIFRDDLRAYATDAAALAVACHAIAEGFDRALTQRERAVLYLPLEHSEDLAHQEHCVRLMRELDEDPRWCDFAERHRDIIARFGRFPHRNAVLGRQTSAAEAGFLEEPDSSF